MIFRFRQLTRILRFLTFRAKRPHYKALNKVRKSIHNCHLLAVFCLLGFCVFRLSSIEVQAKENLDIDKVTFNGDILTETSEHVYSGTVTGGQTLNLSIYSNKFEKLTDYTLDAEITFSYPQTVSSQLNITPFYHSKEQGTIYLAEIGKIYYNGNALTYRTRSYYQDNVPQTPPFNHGGYNSLFGGSASTQRLSTDLSYYFGENETTDYIGLLFQTGAPNQILSFSTTQREVTIKINYLSAVEKATIENAETTKNILEWLTDGFVNLIVPTSDGIQEMLDETASTLESRLGILYLPIRFIGSILGILTATLEGAVSGQSITVPQWNISLFGHDYILWQQTTFSLTDNAIFHYIIFDLGLILIIRFCYLTAMFTAIIQTINTVCDNIFDEEFGYFLTDIEPITDEDEAYTRLFANTYDRFGGPPL